jgi:hypothetical protein
MVDLSHGKPDFVITRWSFRPSRCSEPIMHRCLFCWQVKQMEALQVDGVRATRARYPNMPQGIEARTGSVRWWNMGHFGLTISGWQKSWDLKWDAEHYIRIIIRYIMMYCSNNGMCQQLKYWWDVLLADIWDGVCHGVCPLKSQNGVSFQ